MKFGLFYQLPCAPEQDPTTRYQQTLEQIRYADQLGFDTAWLAELHFNPNFSIMPAPLVFAAVIAQHTSRIRLGTAVALLPLQHPLRTVEEAAVVDVLSHGRLELGVGRGEIAIHFQGFDVPREQGRERFVEALALIHHAWTHETCRFDGKYFHVPDTRIVPRPVQQPHPPLRIAANSPETAVFAGQQGYPVFVASPINRNNKLPEHIGRYQTAFAEAGHDPRQQDVAIAFPVFVADSLEQVRRHVEPSFLNYFRAIGIQARLGARDDSAQYDYLRAIVKRVEAMTWERIEASMGLYGPPARCIDKIRDIAAGCRMDQLICWFNPGGLVPHQEVLTSMRRFAEEVMPAVRHL